MKMLMKTIAILALMICLALIVPSVSALTITGGPTNTASGFGYAFGGNFLIQTPNSVETGISATAGVRSDGIGSASSSTTASDDFNRQDLVGTNLYALRAYYSGTVSASASKTIVNTVADPGSVEVNAFIDVVAAHTPAGTGTVSGGAIMQSAISGPLGVGGATENGNVHASATGTAGYESTLNHQAVVQVGPIFTTTQVESLRAQGQLTNVLASLDQSADNYINTPFLGGAFGIASVGTASDTTSSISDATNTATLELMSRGDDGTAPKDINQQIQGHVSAVGVKADARALYPLYPPTSNPFNADATLTNLLATGNARAYQTGGGAGIDKAFASYFLANGASVSPALATANEDLSTIARIERHQDSVLGLEPDVHATIDNGQVTASSFGRRFAFSPNAQQTSSSQLTSNAFAYRNLGNTPGTLYGIRTTETFVNIAANTGSITPVATGILSRTYGTAGWGTVDAVAPAGRGISLATVNGLNVAANNPGAHFNTFVGSMVAQTQATGNVITVPSINTIASSFPGVATSFPSTITTTAVTSPNPLVELNTIA